MSQAVALLEQDAKALCGVRYARKSDYLCHRGDGDQASVVLEGRGMRFVVHACEEQPPLKTPEKEAPSEMGWMRQAANLIATPGSRTLAAKAA